MTGDLMKNSNGGPLSMQVPWWCTEFSEEEALSVAQSVRDKHISQGPVVAEFEKKVSEYLGVKHVVAATSGSASLAMALMAIGIKPGDEVIVPNRTWIATAHAPFILGAKVKFVDVEHDRPIIDVASIENAITPQTKAIIPVHLNGRSAGVRAIKSIAKKHNIRVIEDAAQALGSRNKDGFLGTQSDIGIFSLSVAKIISSGQGGFAVTNDKSLYEKMVSIRTHGVGNTINADWSAPGFNFRFTDILASIAILQLSRIDDRINKVRNIYEIYLNALGEFPYLKLVPVNIESHEVPIYIEVLCPERDALIMHLKNFGVQARPLYPDLNSAEYFNNLSKLPNSEKFGKNGLFLPSGPDQSAENIDHVISVLRSFNKLDDHH